MVAKHKPRHGIMQETSQKFYLCRKYPHTESSLLWSFVAPLQTSFKGPNSLIISFSSPASMDFQQYNLSVLSLINRK